MVNFGLFGAPQQISTGFACQPNFAQCLVVCCAGTLYIFGGKVRGLLPPNGILPAAKVTNGITSRLVLTARLRPQFRMPPVRNVPDLQSLHAAALPVQSEYHVKRRAAVAVPSPESP